MTSSEARLDMKAGRFLFGLELQHFSMLEYRMLTSSVTNENKRPQFKKQEEEKKRKYQQRLLEVEMGSFTSPPSFGNQP